LSDAPALLWFRRDLRLSDNPALDAALDHGGPVIPVFIWAPEEDGHWPPGGASKWWLHHSLSALDADLRDHDSRLVLRSGTALETLRALIKETGASAVFWNRQYEPDHIARDKEVKAALKGDGLRVESLNGSLIVDPATFFNKQDKPFQVFTPFYKAAVKQVPVPEPRPSRRAFHPPKTWPKTEKLEAFELLPKINWTEGIAAAWTPGEAGAKKALDRFCDEALGAYKEGRDRPGESHTSALSPHLHFGEVTPMTIVDTVYASVQGTQDKKLEAAAESYVREVYWREFAHELLFHFPHTPQLPLRPEFQDFPWADDKEALRAWQKGQTGYPMVDAGMRELWETGWMHNRVRMIAASFLVKHILIPWQAGAEWFWDTLVDADLANNTLGWQWTAGCGADAAPYFRIFNPIIQGKKFDPEGVYVRKWVPEIAKLPNKYLFSPWEAPDDVLKSAGVKLGETYPRPIVEHSEARDRALAAYDQIKKG
jgi:deoxyribodipyrimidine photo-lyase